MVIGMHIYDARNTITLLSHRTPYPITPGNTPPTNMNRPP
jgi:hypothetical protein